MVGRQLGGGHLVLLHHFNEFRIGDLLGAGIGDLVGQEVKEDHQYEGPEDGADENPRRRGPPPPFPLLSWLELNGMDPSVPGERPPCLDVCILGRGTYPAGILSRFGDTSPNLAKIWYHISPRNARNAL